MDCKQGSNKRSELWQNYTVKNMKVKKKKWVEGLYSCKHLWKKWGRFDIKRERVSNEGGTKDMIITIMLYLSTN